MFLGHYQLGDILPVTVWCKDSADLPTEPDAAPLAIVYSSSDNQVEVKKLPIVDRENITGYFLYRASLDASYAAGYYTILVQYVISGTQYAQLWTFEVLGGGNNEGNGIALHYFKQPAADYVLMQTDVGNLKRLRNPSVRGV